MREKVSTSKE